MNRDSIRLADLTWPEIAARVAAGWTRVVFAVGATEQHGPHLPCGTDTMLGDALAVAAAGQAGKTFLAPTINVGVSNHHLGFAGSMSISPETLRLVVLDYVRGLARTGFTEVVILPFHGGNFAAVAKAVQALSMGSEKVAGVRVRGATDLPAFIAVFNAAAAVLGVDKAVSGAHAGESETSLMLHLAPAVPRMDQAKPGFVGDFEPQIPKLWREGMQAVSPNGVIGDPVSATAVRGKIYFESLVAYWLDFIMGD